MTSTAQALREYEDPVEKMANAAARLLKRFGNSRRVKIVPKATGGSGFDVLLDGAVIASIDKDNTDEARVIEAVGARLC